MYPINTYSSQVSPYTAPYPDSPLVVSPLQISAPPSHFSHGHSLPPSPLDTSSPSWLSSHRLEYSPYGRVASFKPASSPNGSSSSHASDDASDESEGRESEEEKQINEEEAGVTQKEPQEEATAELATGKAPVSMPFVRKLRELLRHEELYSDILRWDPSGTIFLVSYRSSRLQEVLKETYGHTNYPSFTRQLNIYNFTRLSPAATADLLQHDTPPKTYTAWKHPSFRRGTVWTPGVESRRGDTATEYEAASMRPRKSKGRVVKGKKKRVAGPESDSDEFEELESEVEVVRPSISTTRGIGTRSRGRLC